MGILHSSRQRLSSRRRPRFSRAVVVCVYSGALSAVAGTLCVLFVHGTGRLANPELPWWAIAAAFVAAEACVVHFEFRRSAHSFSLADIPFVFALLFATGDSFLAGAL